MRPVVSPPCSPGSPDEIQLARRLIPFLPPDKQLSLRVTDNRYTMVAVRRSLRGYSVRIHQMFVAADARLLRAIARYLVHNDPKASAQIGEFIEANQHIIRQQAGRSRHVKVRTCGRFHNLKAIFDRLNVDRFGGELKAKITWGSAPRRTGPRRSIKMGSFSVEDRIIRIHPALDQPDVPAYFVAWIIFHEMLHEKHEVLRGKGGRRCFHSRAFQAEERTFAQYEQASSWERENLDRLLGS